jgi:hypothetical protein
VSLTQPESLSPGAFKYRLPLTFSMVGGPPVAGWISLSRHSEYRHGPQTLLERLNDKVRIVPVVHSDVTHLVNRMLIEYAEAAPGVDASLIGPAAFEVTREEHAHVRLRSGRLLEGVIAMEVAEHSHRTSDFLNGQDDFFALRCGPRTLLVNKRRVRDVRLESRAGSSAA